MGIGAQGPTVGGERDRGDDQGRAACYTEEAPLPGPAPPLRLRSRRMLSQSQTPTIAIGEKKINDVYQCCRQAETIIGCDRIAVRPASLGLRSIR